MVQHQDPSQLWQIPTSINCATSDQGPQQRLGGEPFKNVACHGIPDKEIYTYIYIVNIYIYIWYRWMKLNVIKEIWGIHINQCNHSFPIFCLRCQAMTSPVGCFMSRPTKPRGSAQAKLGDAQVLCTHFLYDVREGRTPFRLLDPWGWENTWYSLIFTSSWLCPGISLIEMEGMPWTMLILGRRDTNTRLRASQAL